VRQLSETFMSVLQGGFLTPLIQRVRSNPDLDLQIRDNYLHIYYKGNSLLKLGEADTTRYKPEIHRKFLSGMVVPDLVDKETTSRFLRYIPQLDPFSPALTARPPAALPGEPAF
jgi:hypothetical protein